MTQLSDVVHQLNRKGTRTNPGGTPNGMCLGRERESDKLILCYRSEKYELNH